MAYRIETRCICGEEGQREAHPYGAITAPIYQTSTFSHPEIGETTGHNYTTLNGKDTTGGSQV